jgi:uncharacterized protein YkuJ
VTVERSSYSKNDDIKKLRYFQDRHQRSFPDDDLLRMETCRYIYVTS